MKKYLEVLENSYNRWEMNKWEIFNALYCELNKIQKILDEVHFYSDDSYERRDEVINYELEYKKDVLNLLTNI